MSWWKILMYVVCALGAVIGLGTFWHWLKEDAPDWVGITVSIILLVLCATTALWALVNVQ